VLDQPGARAQHPAAAKALVTVLNQFQRIYVTRRTKLAAVKSMTQPPPAG
jgi:hypothetical protein